MTSLKIISNEVKLFREIDKKLDKVNVKNIIINSISGEILEETGQTIDNKVIRANYEDVCKHYSYINLDKYMPDLKSILQATIELSLVSENINITEEMISNFDSKCDEILIKVFEFNDSLYKEYIENQKNKMLLNTIPEKIFEINENLSFKNLVMTFEQKISALNASRKKNVKEIGYDFYDYEDKKFEEGILKNIKHNSLLYVSGPTTEEALLYTLYILRRNNFKNTYIVDNYESWCKLKALSTIDSYNSVVFLANFPENSESLEAIPYSTCIIPLDNETSISTDEVISFGKRPKDITIKKLEEILPMEGDTAQEFYTHNKVYNVVEESFNEYPSYKKEILKLVQNYKLTDEEKILVLVGSFNNYQNSADKELIEKHFSNFVDITNINVDNLKIFKYSGYYNILDREEVIHNLIKKGELSHSQLENYIKYASEVIEKYVLERKKEDFFIENYKTISSYSYKAIVKTVKIFSRYQPEIRIEESIYNMVVSNNLNIEELPYIKLELFENILLYNSELLIEQLDYFLTSEEGMIINNSCSNNLFAVEDYSIKLLRILNRLFYNAEYSIDTVPLIIKGLNLIDSSNSKEKYEESLVRYFSYIMNDFPVDDIEKLAYLDENVDEIDQILKIIINKEYVQGIYAVVELEDEFGFKKIKRKRYVQEREKYVFGIQNKYLRNISKINLESFIEDFNIFHLFHENSPFLSYLKESQFDEIELSKAILKLRDKLNWDIKRNKNEKIIENGHKLLKELEGKLRKPYLKYVYVFEHSRFNTLLTLNEGTKDSVFTNSTKIINQKEDEILSLNNVEVENLLRFYFSLKDKWIENFDFILKCMKKCNFNFEEALCLINVNKTNNQIPGFIANYDEFNISEGELYETVKSLCAEGVLESEIGYYVQHITFDFSTMLKFKKEDQLSILKYTNIFRISEKEIYDYYDFMKDMGMRKNCFEFLNHKLITERNIIEDVLFLFKNENKGFELCRTDIDEIYKLSSDYYFSNKTDTNENMLLELSLILIHNIDDFRFIVDKILNSDEFLVEVLLPLAFPKIEDTILYGEMEKVNASVFLMLNNMNMNDIDINVLSNWMNMINKKYENNKYDEQVKYFIASIAGKYFDSNWKIITELDISLLKNKKFMDPFIISYNNTVGVLTGTINEIPAELIKRDKELNELAAHFETTDQWIYNRIINNLISTNDRSIEHFKLMWSN